MQATEANTLHSLFAALCGMRPHLGMGKFEYLHRGRLEQCMPARLKGEAIHSAFYTTSNAGLQRGLGFAEVWSSVEDMADAAPRKRQARRIRWPADWWHLNTTSLMRARADGVYNWLGDHDYFMLPKARTQPPARFRLRSRPSRACPRARPNFEPGGLPQV